MNINTHGATQGPNKPYTFQDIRNDSDQQISQFMDEIKLGRSAPESREFLSTQNAMAAIRAQIEGMDKHQTSDNNASDLDPKRGSVVRNEGRIWSEMKVEYSGDSANGSYKAHHRTPQGSEWGDSQDLEHAVFTENTIDVFYIQKNRQVRGYHTHLNRAQPEKSFELEYLA